MHNAIECRSCGVVLKHIPGVGMCALITGEVDCRAWLEYREHSPIAKRYRRG